MNNERAVIGGNNPPEELPDYDAQLEKLSAELDAQAELGDGILIGDEIENQAQFDQAMQVSNAIKPILKSLEECRVSEKKPHDEAAKAVQAKWMPKIKQAKLVIDTIKSFTEPYLIRQEEERQALIKKKLDEANALKQAAQEAFENSNPTNLEERMKAEELAEEAKISERTAKKVDRSPTGLRSHKTAIINDDFAFCKWLRNNDEKAFNAMLQAEANKRKHIGKMDGVEIITEKKAA